MVFIYCFRLFLIISYLKLFIKMLICYHITLRTLPLQSGADHEKLSYTCGQGIMQLNMTVLETLTFTHPQTSIYKP